MGKKVVEALVKAVEVPVATVEETPVVFRYLSDGSEYHSGIPARDLTADEVAQLDEERQLLLGVSQLYEAVAPAATKDGE